MDLIDKPATISFMNRILSTSYSKITDARKHVRRDFPLRQQVFINNILDSAYRTKKAIRRASTPEPETLPAILEEEEEKDNDATTDNEETTLDDISKVSNDTCIEWWIENDYDGEQESEDNDDDKETNGNINLNNEPESSGVSSDVKTYLVSNTSDHQVQKIKADERFPIVDNQPVLNSHPVNANNTPITTFAIVRCRTKKAISSAAGGYPIGDMNTDIPSFDSNVHNKEEEKNVECSNAANELMLGDPSVNLTQPPANISTFEAMDYQMTVDESDIPLEDMVTDEEGSNSDSCYTLQRDYSTNSVTTTQEYNDMNKHYMWSYSNNTTYFDLKPSPFGTPKQEPMHADQANMPYYSNFNTKTLNISTGTHPDNNYDFTNTESMLID